MAAGSTGQCNTIQSADPQILPRKNRSVRLLWSKLSQGNVSIDLAQPAFLAFAFNAL
jgi:hypothetical protein